MLVKYWMKKDVATIDVGDSMHLAINLMKQQKIALLPVTKKGRLVGVVTDRDIKRASASDATSLDIHELIYLLSQIKIGDIMTKDPVTVPPDYTIEETASILLNNNISGVPVVQDEKVVGLITQLDMFRALISLSGLEKRGVQFAFRLADTPGSIKEVTDIIRNYGGRLVSILTSYERAPAGFRHVYIRAYELNRDVAPKLLEELRQKTEVLYMVDLRDNKREEFVESEPAS
jgi:acetoin utilization protein AcuB